MFAVYGYAALYVLGLVWCYVVIARLPADLKGLTESRGIVWAFATIFVWFLTVIIAAALVMYTLVFVKIIVGLYGLMRMGM